jgi:hypothetical protein
MLSTFQALYISIKKNRIPTLNFCKKLCNSLIAERPLMGGCCRGCRPRPATYDVFPLLLILAVVLILLCLPRLIFSEPIVFETPRLQINWVLIAIPLVLLAIVHWLSSTTYSYRYCPVPPCKRCHYYSCKGCLPCG